MLSDLFEVKVSRTEERWKFWDYTTGIRNASAKGEQLADMLKYEQTVSDLDAPNHTIIHKEVGMLLYLPEVSVITGSNAKPVLDYEDNLPEIVLSSEAFARQSSIPHSTTVVQYSMPGNFLQNNPESKSFPHFAEVPFSPMPSAPPPNNFILPTAAQQLPSYIQNFPPPFSNPVKFLNDFNHNIKISPDVKVMAFTSTIGGGGILNSQFIRSQSDCTEVNSVFYLEKVDGSPVVNQLQYAQRVMLTFPVGSGLALRPNQPQVFMFNWPHISVGTMKAVD